jgi:LuxR family transcriptional regulator, maltose regulon positive regulatory protein
VQTSWLTQTKFIPPRLREDFIPRRRLQDQLLSAIRTYRLTLISAPPGYGKSTLLASLPGSDPGVSIVWMTLDDEDNDPGRFLYALVTAIKCANQQFGEDTQVLLASLPDPTAETRRVMSSLIDEMLVNLLDTWIILDDLHLITQPIIHAALDYLLERIPAHVHLLIATRHDPPLSLARYRARGQLSEIRLSDLRFTEEESSFFLNAKLHLDLSPTELVKLHHRAEGWAAGLRLLAGSLTQIPSSGDRATFIDNLASTDRYVFEFLTDEVLKRLNPEILSFLMETSILPELNPALCDALTGRSDSLFFLEKVYRSNLFLNQLGESRNAFRYHALFSEFLQARLKRGNHQRYLELHRLAAQAQKDTVPSRAVAHYLAAQSWEEAALVIEQARGIFLQQGLLHSLRDWIETLPEPVRQRRPRLQYLLGWSALQRGELRDASTFLESALRGFQADNDVGGQGETLLSLIDLAGRRHDYVHQSELMGQALAFPLPVHGQALLLMAQVWQALFQGEVRRADELLDEALHLALVSNDINTYNLMASMLNMQVAFLPSGTYRLERYCHQILSRFDRGISLIQAGARSLLGYLSLLNGSLEQATLHVDQARSIFQKIGGLGYSEGQALYVVGMVAAIRGHPRQTEELWLQSLSHIEQTPMLRPYIPAVLYFIGRMQWLQNKIDQAQRTYERISAMDNTDEYPETAMTRLLMRAMVEISAYKISEAEVTLRQAFLVEERWRHTVMFGSPRVLLAYLHSQCKRDEEAWSIFAPFLAECERRNLPGLILQETSLAIPLLQQALQRKSHVEFSKRLLDSLSAVHSPQPVTIRETGQTLTRREVEILRLIADGASNQGIAGQLVISEHTVKVHITNIYAKLQVTARTQAIARARQLRLV